MQRILATIYIQNCLWSLQAPGEWSPSNRGVGTAWCKLAPPRHALALRLWQSSAGHCRLRCSYSALRDKQSGQTLLAQRGCSMLCGAFRAAQPSVQDAVCPISHLARVPMLEIAARYSSEAAWPLQSCISICMKLGLNDVVLGNNAYFVHKQYSMVTSGGNTPNFANSECSLYCFFSVAFHFVQLVCFMYNFPEWNRFRAHSLTYLVIFFKQWDIMKLSKTRYQKKNTMYTLSRKWWLFNILNPQAYHKIVQTKHPYYPPWN